jgi:hypothetical protein
MIVISLLLRLIEQLLYPLLGVRNIRIVNIIMTKKTPISVSVTTETGSQAPSDISRCTEAEIRRAAGSKSLARLQAAVESGWAAEELESDAFIAQGKSALQMAAWKGSLENVQYLVEKVGCSVNVYSQAPFGYGKTPIFFAATQSRPGIVDYLLHQPHIQVAIVNNKGQSVMSLAASHEMPHLLPRIQQLEEGQDWWNFRKSHSDGLEYGDQDPRFLDRLLQETDVVTQYSINPTTSQTRKGGFARRNPEAAKEKLRLRQEKQHKKSTKTNKQRPSTELSVEEEGTWEHAWTRLEELSKDEKVADSSKDNTYDSAVLTIIRLGEKQRCPWMPKLINQLSGLKSASRADDVDTILRRAKASLQHHENPERLEILLDKLCRRLQSQVPSSEDKSSVDSTNEKIPSRSSSTNRRWQLSLREAADLLQSDLGKQVRQSISTLSIRQGLEHGDSSILRLSAPPIFVNTTAQVLVLQEELKKAIVVAIDTEWYDSKEPDKSTSVHVSTFQLAFNDSYQGIKMPTYVIDVKQDNSHESSVDDGDYWMLIRDLIALILEDSRKMVLGFSVGHDLPVLERFIGRKLQPTSLLDLQIVLGNTVAQSPSSLPGLKASVAQFSQVPLSKKQQCSDWGQRPLSQSQLDYAGLDAAILLFLLAEYNAATLK